jgi:HK97 family phage prohead protease
MPYFITDKQEDCAGWATVKIDEGGEPITIHCHATKQEAIDQMVAISLKEGLEPGGERVLPDNYRPALADNVPEGRACGNCYFYDESNVQDDKAWCERWDDYVDGGYYCNAWRADEVDDDDQEDTEDDTDDERQVNLDLPDYIRTAAARGLEYYADGLAGDGVVARTIREARLLADGQVSEDKVIRASAWAARHLVDLDAEDNRDPDADGFPGAGAVAFYLWGINPLDPQAAIEWYARKAEQIREEERSVIVVTERAGATIEHMNSTVETRRITVNEFEIREDAATEGMRFAGYAAVFDSPSEPLPFIEQIRPGAFATSLSSRNEIKMFVNHDTTRVLASKRAGTLRLSEDSHGLRVEADLPPTTDGKDLAILMRRGDVDSMSFGFSVPKGGDAWSPDGATRELREVRLHEVSIVTAFPAYAATSAGVRSLENLAAATGADASLLDAAITKLEAGEMLDDEAAMLIESVVQKLRADTTIGSDAKASLEMKRKQLDLLFARV